jgi:hypothetical protein
MGCVTTHKKEPEDFLSDSFLLGINSDAGEV